MRLQRVSKWCAFAALPMLAMSAQAQVVISQVYGGGGNTGGQYRNDFIELFNAGTTTVDLGGWSVQYASATGSSWAVTALSGSLQPGQYLLVQEAAGSNTAAPLLPTPDASGTIAMSGTAGKVALSNSITALSGTCPAAVGLVGFGGANCPTPTATLSNSTAALRKDQGCANSGSNSADFEILAPAPRNRASTLHPCGGGVTPTDPSASASLSAASVEVGESFTLRVSVVPGQNPTSTGLTVVADLHAIGGGASDPLYDDGTHGDSVADDKVYSLATSVAAGTSAGAKLLGVGVGDEQARSASVALTLNVVQVISIHDVQGSGLLSPYAGQTVVVEGVVTARKSNGFFLQGTNADADEASSEGVFVFTSVAPTAVATVGNRLRVQGLVSEFVSSTNPHQLTITELSSPVLSLLSTGNALPAPVEITQALANADSPIGALERLEGMRVAVPSLKVVAPVGAFVTESSASSTSNGVFFGVLPDVARPFREAGVGALDTTVFPGGVHPPVFDTNPERIRVQSTGQQGAIALGADVGDVIGGLVGVLDYGFGAYSLLPDPSAELSVVSGANPTPVSAAKGNEITIGGFNLERFFDDVDAPGTSDPVLTPTALENRLKKTANAICGYVRTPDILGVVEVENLPVLQKLADHINAGDTLFPGSCAKNPQYAAYLQEGNDIGGIDIGFLLSAAEVAPGLPRVQVLEIAQIGKDSLFTNKDGSTSLLNDRPSLLLRARVNQANGAHYDVTVIANHLRSLTDVNSMAAGSNGWGTAGERVRAKRAAQAKELAEAIQARQQANPGERIVLLGDFNAFEFNDGYTDSMGVITGREAGPDAVLDYVDSPITVPLTNMAELSPAEERYSFSFDGSAQSLDHMVVNQAVLDTTAGVRAEHARINADFGEDNLGDFSVPVRVSDHDPVVLFLSENAFANADLAVSVQASTRVTVGQPALFGIGVANAGPDAATAVRLELRLNLAIPGTTVQAPTGWECGDAVLDATGTAYSCRATALANGASASFAVSVPTDRELGGRSLGLGAQVSSPMTDLATLNNLASDGVVVAAAADLASSALAPKGPLPTKKPANFLIGIANAGPQDARAAVLVIAVSGPRQVVAGIATPASMHCALASETPAMSTWACPSGDWYASGASSGIVLTVNPYYSATSTLSVGTGFSSETADPQGANNAGAAAVRVAGATATLH